MPPKRKTNTTGKRKTPSRTPLKDSDSGSARKPDLMDTGDSLRRTTTPTRLDRSLTSDLSLSLSGVDLSDRDTDTDTGRDLSLPPTKRSKTLTLTRAPSGLDRSGDESDEENLPDASLTPQPHDNLPAMATVRMKPLVVLDDEGNIKNLLISSQQRTPSPFGGPMGDHTVAWSALVDAVRASVHGLPVDEAVGVLRTAQEHAEAWMADPDSTGMRLLDMLPDKERRVGPLEHWAWQVTAQLDTAASAAESGDNRAAATALQQAIAHHLAYLNYLPFATVPAASERGSKGSAESAKRRRILAAEGAGPLADAELATDPDQAGNLRDDLWGMFAFDAALRESDAWLVLNPGLVDSVKADHAKLKALWTRLDAEMTRHSTGSQPQDEARAIEKLADELRRSTPEPSIMRAALKIRDSANLLWSDSQARLSTRQKSIVNGRIALKPAMDEAATAVDDFVERARDAIPHASVILANLLHEHQRTVATSYPRAVTVSGFLGPTADTDAEAAANARKAALDRLTAEMARAFPPPLPKDGEPKATGTPPMIALTQAVADRYAEIGSVPTPATRNSWITDSSNEELVVTYDSGAPDPLSVNGRAAAPTGVAGMGSHTTAWTVEVDALKAMVAGAKGEAAALAALSKETLRDLGSEVMKLDRLLPAEQLEGGQLLDIFTQAAAVISATDVAAAATAFLSFRNLLPFATLDAGDRSGHGERSGGPKSKNFDGDSLNDAAGLIQDALADPDARAKAVQALEDAASALANEDWGTKENLRKRAEDTIRRLRGQAITLRKGAPRDVVTTIYDVRSAEHSRVTKQAAKLAKTTAR
ncbi:hypothetical protein [Micromonospora sp. NBC_01796]|uniref:hypothetical protein n=1 Tax=Micromonospora sp. NBC_01796 TaxID=2975987 RepID=UPI002DDAD59F|nr:hypothetical protein [Micromonospora sp. NBC_01796]WSA85135.1 hypothetical protein OIE47_33045 [Micromonospora sp. NBC_01796]